jgi:hypothetical protein
MRTYSFIQWTPFTPSQQKQVYAAVQQIMTSDKYVSAWESTLLSQLGLKFGM